MSLYFGEKDSEFTACFTVHDAWAGHGGRNDDHDNGADRHGDQGRGGEQE